MIIKNADDHTADIACLEGLLQHPDATPAIRKKIDTEIKRVKAGERGEKAAAYEIDRLFGKEDRYAVIHDLRIEIDGQVAQIDHLILNCFMTAFICETKNFAEGIGCNEHGEWVGFRNGKPFGIASPLRQGERQSEILQELLEQRHEWHPRKLGEYLGVPKQHFVLISNTARISRPPEGTVPDIDRVVKIESFKERRQKYANKMGFFESWAKEINPATLRTFAEGLASCHVPAAPDWHAKFGLSSADTTEPLPEIEDTASPQSEEGNHSEKKKLVCAKCDAALSFAEARFCWRSKKRFGGNAYCRSCQADV